MLKSQLVSRRSIQSRSTDSATAAASGDDESTLKLMGLDLGIKVATAKKVFPLSMMFFGILFNYTILRDTKVGLSHICEIAARIRLAFEPFGRFTALDQRYLHAARQV